VDDPDRPAAVGRERLDADRIAGSRVELVVAPRQEDPRLQPAVERRAERLHRPSIPRAFSRHPCILPHRPPRAPGLAPGKPTPPRTRAARPALVLSYRRPVRPRDPHSRALPPTEIAKGDSHRS